MPIRRPPGKASPFPDLYLLGTGIYSSLQLTLETIQALEQCKTVFALHDDEFVLTCLRDYCRNVVDVSDCYTDKSIRRDAYVEISHRVVDAALHDPPVALIAHGHPLFLVSAAEYTLQLGNENGLFVEVLSAISSFDTILTALKIDFGYGIQIYDATTLLRESLQIESRAPVLIMQLATLLNDRVVRTSPGIAELARLRDRLLEFYPQDAPCTYVQCASHMLDKTQLVRTTLAELIDSEHIELWRRPSLYVTPK